MTMTPKQLVKTKFPKAKAVKVMKYLNYTLWQVKMGNSVIAESISGSMAWQRAYEKLFITNKK